MRALALAAVALAGCVQQKPPHVPIDPALVMLVSPDTITLAGVRLDRLQKLPYYDRLLSLGPSAGLSGFLTKTGLDPHSKLWELLLASNGKDTVAMLRGTFSPMGLEPQLQREGAKRIPYKGYMMLGDEKVAVLFVNSSTAVAGQPAALRSIVDHRSEFDGIPAALMRQVETVEYATQIWAVSLSGFFPGLQESAGNWGNAGKLLERTRSFTFAATFNGDLRFDAKGECASSHDAGSLEGVARGMVAIGRFAARKTPAVQSFYGAISVGRQDRTVTVRASVPAAVLDKALNEMIPTGH